MPSGWSENKLGELFKKRSSSGLDNLPTVSVTIDRGLVLRENLDRKMETTLEASQHLLVKKGDIAYNMMRMWQGALGLADFDCIVSPAYVVCEPKDIGVCSKFFYYLFKTPPLIKRFKDSSRGLTEDRLRLYYDDFEKIKVRSPSSFQEQEKIAKILSTWDKAIETSSHQITLENQILKEMISTVLLKDSIEVTFDELFSIANDKAKQIKSSDYLTGGQFPVVDQGQSLICGFTNDESKVIKNIPVVIFGDHTREIKLIDFEFAPGADGTQVLKTNKGFDNRLGYYALKAIQIPSLGYARHFKAVKEARYRIPKEQNRERAVSILSAQDKKITFLESYRKSLVTQKQGLMQQLLFGKKRVKV